MASSLAERFVVLVYDQPKVVMQISQLRSWGVAVRVTSIRAVDLEITEMSAQPDRLRERFVEIGVPALDPLALALHLASLARSGVTNSRAAYPKASLD